MPCVDGTGVNAPRRRNILSGSKGNGAERYADMTRRRASIQLCRCCKKKKRNQKKEEEEEEAKKPHNTYIEALIIIAEKGRCRQRLLNDKQRSIIMHGLCGGGVNEAWLSP